MDQSFYRGIRNRWIGIAEDELHIREREICNILLDEFSGEMKSSAYTKDVP